MGRIEKSLEVKAPIDACYRIWTDFAGYYRFVKHLQCIRPKGDPNVWHWEIEGPEGKRLAWDIQLDAAKHGNRVISWHTIRQADIAHAGAITLTPLNDGSRTRINLVVEYRPVHTHATATWTSNLDAYLNTAAEETLRMFCRLAEEAVVSVAAHGTAKTELHAPQAIPDST